MIATTYTHTFVARPNGRCVRCGHLRYYAVHSKRLNVPLARVLFERAQDGYVNPTGGKTTGRERKDA